MKLDETERPEPDDAWLLRRSREVELRAREVLSRMGIVEAWQEVGAEVRPVGSLRMGLMMRHLDIDLHVYDETLRPVDDFALMGRIAALPGIRSVDYRNLSDTEEACLEWHLRYVDGTGDEWKLDLIHIRRGSRYDGWFERVADRIAARLTDADRVAVLRLKWAVPEPVPGIVLYRAVLEGGVRTIGELRRWYDGHPLEGVDEWMP